MVQTVYGEPRSQEFADGEIERIVARGGTNLWIQIRGADMHIGLMTSRMNVHRANGHRIKQSGRSRQRCHRGESRRVAKDP